MKDLIIIGSGPAGLTAAIYAKRAELDVIIFEKSTPGGQVVNISKIDNYPGVMDKSGPDIAYTMYEQVNKLGVPFYFEDVLKIEKKNNYFNVKTDKSSYETKTVLIATGTTPRKLNIAGEDKYSGLGISWCALCDGPLYKNMDVIVIGGGNSAVSESIFLAKIASHITILQNLDHLTAEKGLTDILNGHSNIKCIYGAKVLEFIGDDKGLTGLKYLDKDTKKHTLNASGVFEYIGLNPNSEFLSDLNITDKHGYIITDDSLETEVSGIFAAGDITNRHIRQIVTATSDGAVSVSSILKYLEKI